MATYLIDFFFALIGLLVQSLIKIQSINNRTNKDVKIPLILNTYLREDYAKILISFLCIFLEIAALDILNNLPEPILILGFKSTLFVQGKHLMLPFVTFFSSTLVFIGKTKAEKFINTKLK